MMPAGTYYVGDLCYILDNEWDEVCRLTIQGNDCLEGEFVLRDGRKFAMYGTAWGDGEYLDQLGRSYAVDSGTLGCVQVPEGTKAPWGGQLHVFENDFDTAGCVRPRDWGSNTSSIVRFGKLKIETNPSDSSDEEEDDYAYEDE